MQKQKKGFWLFIFSLIPGAGEMYMGFKKQGLSTMLLFLGLFAFGAGARMGWLLLFSPIIWFYSFFNVHNLKSLSEEEFYSVEDSYILHLDAIVGDTNALISKYRKAIAILLIVFGGSILWNSLVDSLVWILPQWIGTFLRNISYRLPQFVIAVAIILAGIYLLSDKKQKLETTDNTKDQDEHFWQPYRPYQQPEQPVNTDREPEKATPKETPAEPVTDINPTESESTENTEKSEEN